MKRSLSLILAALLLASSMTACGNTAGKTEPKETEKSETQAVATKAPATDAPATDAPATNAPETEEPAVPNQPGYPTDRLTENGAAMAHIVLSANATDRERKAAEELVYHIKLVSGADIAVADAKQEGSLPIYIGRLPC